VAGPRAVPAAWAAAPAAAFGMARPQGIQRKPVTIGAPDDAYEREADRVADHVAAGPSSAPPRITPITPGAVQRATSGDPTHRGDEPRPRQSIPARLVQRMAGAARAAVAFVQRATAGDRTEHDDPPRASATDTVPVASASASGVVQRATEADDPAGQPVRARRRIAWEDGGEEMREAAARAIASRGPGAPLVPGVRALLEARMGARLGHVRVHTDAEAQRATARLGARAFTHGSDIWLGRGESPADTRLIAHEATHVVQQGAATQSPAHASASPGAHATTHAPAWADASVAPAAFGRAGMAAGTAGFASPAPSWRAGAARTVPASPAASPASASAAAAGTVQRLFLPQAALDKLDEYARYVPGWSLFTVVIGYNPLTGRDVPRTAVNLVGGFMGLVPFGTAIFDKLNEHGLVQAGFDWVSGELRRLDLSLGRLERTVSAAWDDVSVTSGFDYNLAVLKRHFKPLYDDVVAFAGSLVDKLVALIKEAAIGVAESLLAENRAWALIKKILGRDPLRDLPVQATPAEILSDFLLLIGKEEHLRQMRERGTLEASAAWIAQQIATFLSLLVELKGLFTRAWDAIQPSNIANLGTSLRALAADAGAFLRRVWDFATTVAAKVLELIKKSLLAWLASYANEVQGFHLVTVILGKNPFTNEPVPRTAQNLIRGFITLLPNGAAIYARLEESGTIAGAAARIQGAMESLGISWAFITGLFTGLWNTFSIDDLVHPLDAFARVVEKFGEPISRLFRFVGVVLREIIWLVLEAMSFPSDLIGSIVANAMAAIDDVKRDPVGFLLNMLSAVKRGFASFFGNIATHLMGGLTDWLFRGLRQAGIEPPKDLSLRSVLGFVLQVLGISLERIWQKLGERIGPEKVARIRGAIDRLTGIWSFIKDVQERGVAAIWEYIEGQITGLWDMVLEKARAWIMERVIDRAVKWLLSLLDPTGIMPVINSFIAFFKAVQSAIEYLRDILAIVNDYVATIAAVARGDVEPGAKKIELGLAHAVPVAIGFLANQFGLGNLGEKITEIVGGIREVVDRALDWLLDKAIAGVQSLLKSLGFGKADEKKDPKPGAAPHDSADEPEDWWRSTFGFTDATGAKHTLLFNGTGRGATLVVHSDEHVVATWLVELRERSSAGVRPLVEEAMRAHARYLETKDHEAQIDAEWKTLPLAQQEARQGERRTVYLTFKAALRELGRTFSALPVEGEPDKIVLKVPKQKPLGPYQGLAAARQLQHSRQRPERSTEQREMWERHVKTEMTAEMKDLGARLGLEEWQVLRPNWGPDGRNVPMQVDHKIEWQVRRIGDEESLDQIGNYELLDKFSNGQSGDAIKKAVEEERVRIAGETKDRSWLQRDITFTEATGGGTAGRRWSFNDIVAGKHLQVYMDKNKVQPAGPGLPSSESVRGNPGDRGVGAATLDASIDLQWGLKRLKRDHGAEFAALERMVQMRLLRDESWGAIETALGISTTVRKRYAGWIQAAGITL